MDLTSSASIAMGSVLVHVPILGIWLAGIGWAIKTWPKHPKVSLLVTIALIILCVDTLMNSILSIIIPMQLAGAGRTVDIGLFFMVKGVASALIHWVVWIMILWAIFGWRDADPENH